MVALPLLLSLAPASAGSSRDAAAAEGAGAPLVVVRDTPVAPPLQLATLSGGTFALSVEGGATIVHFFATWCEPCRVELPALGRFAARHPRVRVVLVDVAEVEASIQRFFATLPGGAAPFSHVLLDRDRSAARTWGVSLLPATFVVAGGRLRFSAEGEVDWDGVPVSRLIGPLAEASPARGMKASQITSQEER
ncbi:TlpA disulfide reductase family protein [Xanthobacter autotrophicus DSM 431]|uniref:TlpA family protein disulfide reductase n=1 Tax=Xanthobacter nonsaccharivorans TaxID=3119912 RepID=UPI00372C30FC